MSLQLATLSALALTLDAHSPTGLCLNRNYTVIPLMDFTNLILRITQSGK